MSRTIEVAESERLPFVAGLALFYLGLPTLVFVLGWFRWPVALPLAVLALLAFAAGWDGCRRWPARLSSGQWGVLAVVAAVAIGWSSLGGAGHLCYANFDWITRDAVLRDLVATAWPPAYGVVDAHPFILRAPVGYFLPVALLAKLTGAASADVLLLGWTVMGVALFLWLAVPHQKLSWRLVAGLMVIILFSGMDAIGFALMQGRWPAAGEHIEWWARLFQYSSNSTLLFWTPNHALPGWIGAALLYRYGERPAILRLVPPLVAFTPLWSPLAAFGLIPFFALVVWRHRAVLRDYLDIRSLLPALGVAAVVARYLLMDGSRVPGGWTLGALMQTGELARVYLLFLLLEFGLLGVILLLRHWRTEILVAMVFLLVLPIYHAGPGNDLVMRGGIAALAMLCLACVDAMVDQPPAPGVLWKALMFAVTLFLAVGAVTPFQEIERALTQPAWKPARQGNLVEASDGAVPPHYIGRLNIPFFAWSMSPVHDVPYALFPGMKPEPIPVVP